MYICLFKLRTVFDMDLVIQVQEHGAGNCPVERADGEDESVEGNETVRCRCHALQNWHEEQCH